MDPRQTLIDLLEAIAARDHDGARWALEEIEEWLRKGGFMPEQIHGALDVLRFGEGDSRV